MQKTAYSALKDKNSDKLALLKDVFSLYKSLHNLNITHLDATFKNILIANDGLKAIDFEYYAGENFSLQAQSI